jgi:hypothetical protein
MERSSLEYLDRTVLRSSPKFFEDRTTVQSQKLGPDHLLISPVQSGLGPTVQSGQSSPCAAGIRGSKYLLSLLPHLFDPGGWEAGRKHGLDQYDSLVR